MGLDEICDLLKQKKTGLRSRSSLARLTQGDIRMYVITKYAITTHATAKTFGLHLDITR